MKIEITQNEDFTIDVVEDGRPVENLRNLQVVVRPEERLRVQGILTLSRREAIYQRFPTSIELNNIKSRLEYELICINCGWNKFFPQ